MTEHSSSAVDEPAVRGARRAALAALFNIGFGLVAVAFTVMATRRLGITEASQALVAWSVLTVLGAVTQQPAEIYAPRLAFEIRRAHGDPAELRRMIVELVAVGTATSVCAVLAWGLATSKGPSWYPGPVAVVVGFGALYVHRSRLVGVGEFGRLTLTAAVTGAGALTIAFLAVTAGFGNSTSDMLLLTALSFSVPMVAELADWRATRNQSDARRPRARPVPVRAMFATSLSLGGTSAVSLLFFAGGPPIGSLLGMEPEILTSYAVTSSLAAVAFIMMSSAMLPLLNRSVELVEDGQWNKLIPTLTTAIGLSTGVVLVVAVASALVGPFALDAYIGGGFVLDRSEIVAVFVAAGTTAISNTPRLMITALGRAPSFNRWLVASVAIYVLAVLFTPDLPLVWRITGATFLAAGALTMIGFLSVARMVRSSGRSTREEPSTA